MGVVTTLPRSRPLTWRDLADAPDDGHRYELVDGVLVVTPAPSRLHQRAVLELAVALRAACPPDLEVLVAPLDVILADDTSLQPDVLVARMADLSAKNLPAAPVLAAEVSSPSTRLFDLNLKKARLEAAGCESYWVVDPDLPSLTAWNLGDDGYQLVGKVTGDEVFEASRPFQVQISPSTLVRRRHDGR